MMNHLVSKISYWGTPTETEVIAGNMIGKEVEMSGIRGRFWNRDGNEGRTPWKRSPDFPEAS
jgi:hypothetical protein